MLRNVLAGGRLCLARRLAVSVWVLGLVAAASSARAQTIDQFDASCCAAENQVTLTWRTTGGNSPLLYIYGPRLYLRPNENGDWIEDVGFHAVGPADGSPRSFTFRAPPGTHRYTLSHGAAGDSKLVRHATVHVPRPQMPQIGAPPPAWLSPFQPADTTIRWNANALGPGSSIRITRPNGSTASPTATGEYAVPHSEVAARGFGRHLYRIEHCRLDAAQRPHCSEPATVPVQYGMAEFTHRRVAVPSGANVTLRWTGPGNFWALNSGSLELSAFVSDQERTIFQPPDGRHVVRLASCFLHPDLVTAECATEEARHRGRGRSRRSRKWAIGWAEATSSGSR
ncbi:MAG: hypothetical protein MJE66_06315 [Proteobacteria bacterium]|nr:hypothetical protein [Pseudomonadota bacterium]